METDVVDIAIRLAESAAVGEFKNSTVFRVMSYPSFFS
jgi:hypothetical protein